MVLRQAFDVVPQRVKPSSRDYSSLTQPSSKAFAPEARTFDEGARGADQAPHGRAQSLGEADLDAVDIAHQIGGLHPQRHRRVEEAGPIDMDIEPTGVGPRRALGYLLRCRGVPSPPVVGTQIGRASCRERV